MNKFMRALSVSLFLAGLILSYSTVTNVALAAYPEGCTAETTYSKTTGQKCNGGAVLGDSVDTTPRIMYWYGKVNQHVNSEGIWLTDPDGTSGANLDKLTYCKKWYPSTTSVEPYKSETLDTWRAAGNTGAYTATFTSDKCVQGNVETNHFVSLTSHKSGDTFTQGQYIDVRWTSNADSSTYVYLSIMDSNSSVIKEFRIPNDGQERIKIPQNTPVGQYKVYYQVVYGPNASGYHMTDFAVFNVISSTVVIADSTPRIGYWYGKVNQHVDSSGNWLTDPDGISGANLDKLTYCQKFYPKTTSIQDYKTETISGWRERGNVGGPYTLAITTIKCIEGIILPPTQLEEKVFIMGGSDRTGQFNDVWSSADMSNWNNNVQNGSTSTWSSRNLARSVYLNGRIYLIGGNKGNDNESTPVSYQFWSSPDGSKWQKLDTLPWNSDPYEHTLSKSYITYKGKIWAIGGLNHDPAYCNPFCYKNNVWSYDGSSWKKEANAPWAGRELTGLTVYNGKIFMIGGYVSPTEATKEVWSFDGSTWKQETSLPYSLVFETGQQPISTLRDQIWILGNMRYGGNNVLSFDGSNWQTHETAPWIARGNHVNLVANNKIYLFGGLYSEANTQPTYLNDVWSFDGSNWVKLPDATWPARGYFDAVVTPINFGAKNSDPIQDNNDGTNGCHGTKYNTTTGKFCNNWNNEMTNNSNPGLGKYISSTVKRVLKIGVRGDDVKILQEALKLKADGVFGKGTAAKVKEWQVTQGMKADGIFGSKSNAMLFPSN